MVLRGNSDSGCTIPAVVEIHDQSVAVKLKRSRFTRVQRLSCCLSVLLTAMLTNAMFYNLEGKYEQPIQVGPLKMSWRQVVTGIESALVVTPINIFIMFLFQKGAEKSAMNNDYCLKGTLISGIAWCLLFFSCSVSAAFSIFYSLIWEKSVSEQWLSSMLISFAQDVTIKEPVKVFFTALTFAAILKIKAKTSKVHACESPQQVKTGYYKKHFWALKLSEVEEMRRRQAKKQNLARYLTELGLYLVFVFFLMAVCYGNRNDHRYLMTKSIRDGLKNFGKVSKHCLIIHDNSVAEIRVFNLSYNFSFSWRLKIKYMKENFTLPASSRTGIFFRLYRRSVSD